MKSRKGFTLIELLAVIVILAIIALIAIPQILGVIDTARKGAAKDSALGYVDAVEKSIMLGMIDDTKGASNGEYSVSGTTLTKGSETITVDVKGTTPDSDSASKVCISNNTVLAAELTFNKFKYVLDGNGNATLIEGDAASTYSCSVTDNTNTNNTNTEPTTTP